MAASQQIRQGQGGLLATAPDPVLPILTGLTAFGGINTVQPNPLASDFNSVGVNHTGLSLN